MKFESLLNHDSLIDDEAMVETIPFDPVYAKPCERDGRQRDDPNVDEAVEKRPANPMTVEVELQPVFTVNGNEPVRFRQFPEMAQQPVVMFEPTLEVEVAWPITFNPRIVVVPKPERAISRAEVDVVAVPATVVVEMQKLVPSFLIAICPNPPPADKASCEAVDEAIVREDMLVAVVDVPIKRDEVVAEKLSCG